MKSLLLVLCSSLIWLLAACSAQSARIAPPPSPPTISNVVWSETFDAPQPLLSWHFEGGNEFSPGATGTLGLASDAATGRALELSYSMDCAGKNCAHYAAAVGVLPQPVEAQGLRVQLHAAALQRGARVNFRVVDTQDQTLQFQNAQRCPFETATETWCDLESDLRFPAYHWGGSNDGVIHGGIKQIWLLVNAPQGSGDRATAPFVGAVQFDNVTLKGSQNPVSLSDLVWKPLRVDGLAERLGVNLHISADAVANRNLLEKAKAAGFSFVRTDLVWQTVEQNGQYTFGTYDRLLEDARSLGLRMLYILDYRHSDYALGDTMSTLLERQAFSRYAAASAAHFQGQDVRFEIWNEENSGDVCTANGVTTQTPFWSPANPVLYADLVKISVAAMRAVNPSAQIVIGGLVRDYTPPCSTELPTQYSYQFIDSLAQNGGLDGLDALGYHPYYATPEDWGAELSMVQGLLRDLGHAQLPVWDTEWGNSSACPDEERPCADGQTNLKRKRQALKLARRFLVALALNVPVNVWYDLRDDGTDPQEREHHFGVYDFNLGPKPALSAMQTLAGFAGGAITGQAVNLPAGMHVVRFERGGETVFAAWLDIVGSQLELNLPTAGLVSVQDVLGHKLGRSETLNLREADGPVWLRYDSSGAVSRAAHK